MKNNEKNSAGFSLIEALVYITILALVLGVFMDFTVNIARASNRLVQVKEVNQNFRLMMSRLSQDIKTASQVVSVSPDRLELRGESGQVLVYHYSPSDRMLYLDEGGGSKGLAGQNAKVAACVFSQIGDSVKVDLGLRAEKAAFGQAVPYALNKTTYVVLRKKIY